MPVIIPPMSEPSSRIENKHIAFALALLVLSIYLITASFRFHSIDEIAVFSVARSLLGHGSFDGDVIFWTQAPLGFGSIVAQGINGHTYVVKDVSPSLLMLPLVWFAQVIGASPVRAALLLSPIVSAIIAALLYRVITSWGYSRMVGVLGGLTFAFASLNWPYAETLFTQTLAGLGLLIALHGTIRAYEGHGWQAALLGGLGLGLAGLSAVPTWVSIPVYVLYLIPWESIRSTDWRAFIKANWPLVLAFGAGLGLFAGFQAVYNLMRFGSPFQTGYQQVGAAGIRPVYFLLGSLGQLVSTPRGVIWYAPFVLLVPFGLAAGWRGEHRRRLILALAQVVIIFGLYSSYATWWAGVSWGPRFLVALMPSLTLLIVPLFEKLLQGGSVKSWIAPGIVLLFSTFTQIMTSLFDYLESEAPISRALMEITPPPGLIVRAPILSDLRALPWVRQVQSAGQGNWDVLWMTRGNPDWLLLVLLVGLIGLAVWWMVRAYSGRTTRYGLVAQSALTIGLMAFMLLRYPEGPDEVPGLDQLVAGLDERIQPGDGVIAVLPTSYIAWVEGYHAATPDYGFVFENPLSTESGQMLERIDGWHERIWLVSEGTVGGNPDNAVEYWLAQNGYVGTETWIEGYRLVAYALPDGSNELTPVGQAFGEGQIELVSAAYEVTSDGWLNVWLRWEADQTPVSDYTVFAHVLDSNGMLVAQHDGIPAAGYAPTSSWGKGQTVDDQRSIDLSTLADGPYTVLVGLYNPADGQRLLLTDNTTDAFQLGIIEITSTPD